MFILYDRPLTRQNLLPLTYLRPIADCRVGIWTIREKWQHLLGTETLTLSEPYLEGKFPFCHEAGPHIYINGAIIPTAEMAGLVKGLKEGQSLHQGEATLAYCTSEAMIYGGVTASADESHYITYTEDFQQITSPSDIFKLNGTQIEADFKLITAGRTSQPLSETNTLLGDKSQIFIEEGASVECSTFNVKGGPVYIGRDAEIMEGCLIRGPFALGDHAGLKMAAKVYGATTVGPHCRVGGEVSNAVFFAYSNKGHDGFIGNSVIAEWCNLGADTNCSNLKNNYGTVDVWNYTEGKYISSGLQFHGIIMGDHAKSGINTMFNTGTVIGVAANVFDGGFPQKFIPSFTWGGAGNAETFRFDKATEVAERMMIRREVKLSQGDIDMMQVAFDRDEKYRTKKS
jgi:UDP-N-acetylglucosamine diphosphorylase/glucosamine-1-phosphate N-acetyltransferase